MAVGLIYQAFDTSNGKSYIGQTWLPWPKRMVQHLGGADKRPSRNGLLKNALHARPEAFIWTVLTTHVQTQKELDDAETYWGTFFDVLHPNGYCLKLGRGRGLMSDETKSRLSASLKRAWSRPEARARMVAAAKECQNRPGVKVAQVAARQGQPGPNLGRKFSAEWKQKLRANGRAGAAARWNKET